ncbi:(3R)-3-hydroxyacyl-CoA dehydrogenase-like isoform X2 [Cavia porcellus]|uniref:(3R)-3-hydroxyacyl-CoA dehydrogenase-like isoform X2 n=1 Tax=Cavia porcellus TaxID=10141 RepID=UPI000C87D233|nr:estradiol 17-beta-dehydrogenase 8-like isoform X2 [Cavia porcellus]
MEAWPGRVWGCGPRWALGRRQRPAKADKWHRAPLPCRSQAAEQSCNGVPVGRAERAGGHHGRLAAAAGDLGSGPRCVRVPAASGPEGQRLAPGTGSLGSWPGGGWTSSSSVEASTSWSRRPERSSGCTAGPRASSRPTSPGAWRSTVPLRQACEAWRSESWSISDIINCNAMSVAQMVRIVLPQMVSRGKGVIINMSSQSGSMSSPLFALYSATKAFVRNFSEAVCAEYILHGVTIQTLSPVMVSTNMMHNAQIGLLVKDANEFAREALDTLGLSSHVSGCLWHSVQSFLLPFVLPQWLRHSRWMVNFLSARSKSKRFLFMKPQGT